MNKISSILAIAVLAFVAFGCRSCETIDSSKLDPSEIYQEYTITVADDTTVSAGFRVSGPTGTTIALVAPAKVEYNGGAMSENLRTILSGTYYSAGSSGFAGSHTFVFADSSGRQFKNSIEFDPIKINSNDIILSNSGKSIVIPLSRPLVDGESITAYLRSDAEPPAAPANTGNSNTNASAGPDYSRDLSGTVDNRAQTLSIETDQFRNFIAGKARLYVVLSASRIPTAVGIRGGNISYSIQSPTVTANVTN